MHFRVKYDTFEPAVNFVMDNTVVNDSSEHQNTKGNKP